MARVGNPFRPPVQADQGTATVPGLDPSLGGAQPTGGAAAASPAQGGAAAATPTQSVPPSAADQLETHLSAGMAKVQAEVTRKSEAREKANAEERVKAARRSGETVKQTKARMAKEVRDKAKAEEAKAREIEKKEAKEKFISPITASASRSRNQLKKGPEGVQPRDLSTSLNDILSQPDEELEDTQE